jgi:hypothetical protein
MLGSHLLMFQREIHYQQDGDGKQNRQDGDQGPIRRRTTAGSRRGRAWRRRRLRDSHLRHGWWWGHRWRRRSSVGRHRRHGQRGRTPRRLWRSRIRKLGRRTRFQLTARNEHRKVAGTTWCFRFRDRRIRAPWLENVRGVVPARLIHERAFAARSPPLFWRRKAASTRSRR